MHVAVSGGGCSGKTSTVTQAAALLRSAGVRVLVAEEAASRVIGDAVPDIAQLRVRDPAGFAAAQAAMIRHARDQRLTFGALASALGGGVVLHDRAEFDGLPYGCVPSVAEIVAERGETLEQVAAAYRLVFFLEPPPPQLYETRSNAARYEPYELALRQSRELEAGWRLHKPDVRLVPWAADVAAKAELVAAAVTDALAAAVPAGAGGRR